MSDYRILVTGSRHRTDREIAFQLSEALERVVNPYDDIIFVHGGATGVDFVTEEWVWSLLDAEIKAEAHPADWNTRGKAAGPERNQRMVDLGADICLAFPAADSRGTWDCIKRAVAAGIETRIYPEVTR